MYFCINAITLFTYLLFHDVAYCVAVYEQPSNEQHETVSVERRQNRNGEEEGRSANSDHQAERLRGQIHRIYA